MNTAPPGDKVDRQVLRIAAVLIVGAMAVIFDTTIVSVALPTLAAKLQTSVATVQWVSTGYLLALGVTMPLVGWAQGRFGGKRLWLFALLVFLVGSVASSLAWNAPSLIAFRAVQGVGGGVMMTLMMTLVMQAAGGKALGRTTALVSLPGTLGPILGPVLGGLILHSLDWRWLFWVNVPFCAVGFLLAWKFLPADTPQTSRPRLDARGFALLAPGILGLLYGLSNVSGPGGFTRADALPPLLTGVALLAAYTVHATRPGRRALVDVRLFAHRGVAAGSSLLFLTGIALYGGMLLLPLYFTDVRGTGALGAGLLLAPQGVGALCGRTLAGRLTDSVGARRVTVVGFVIIALATVPFALAGAHTGEWALGAALVVRGFGLAAVTVPLMTVAFVGLDRPDVPQASMITRIAQQLGGSFGIALLAVLLNGALARTASDVNSRAHAYDQAFWWAVGFTGLAVLLSLALPGRPRTAVSEPATRPAPATTARQDPSVRGH